MRKLREKVPCVQSLDLRWNLLSSVNSLYGIHCLGSTLIDLDLSHNKLNMFYCFDNNNNSNNGNGKIDFSLFNRIFEKPGTLKIRSAKINCIPTPDKTKRQLIDFL